MSYLRDSARLAELREEIASRLRPVCADWPDERFAELVEHIATTTFKYESRPGFVVPERQLTDAVLKRIELGLQRSQHNRPRPPSLAEGLGSIPHVLNRGILPPRTRPSREQEPGV